MRGLPRPSFPLVPFLPRWGPPFPHPAAIPPWPLPHRDLPPGARSGDLPQVPAWWPTLRVPPAARAEALVTGDAIGAPLPDIRPGRRGLSRLRGSRAAAWGCRVAASRLGREGSGTGRFDERRGPVSYASDMRRNLSAAPATGPIGVDGVADRWPDLSLA